MGCYSVHFSGWDNQPGSTDRMEVRALPGGDYDTVWLEAGSRQSLAMKPATRDEKARLADGLKLRVSDGISLKWPEGATDTKPVGIYRVSDSQGSRLLAYFFIGSGLATRETCR